MMRRQSVLAKNRSQIGYDHRRLPGMPLWIILTMIGAGQAAAAEALTIASPELTAIFAGRSPASVTDLRMMQDHFRELARHVQPAVVHLRIGKSHGSGVIISARGHILTAAHVVGGLNHKVSVQLPDGRFDEAEALGLHLEHDLALLRIKSSGPWPYVPLGKRSSLQNGAWCAAFGHPGGFDAERGPVLRLGRILDHDSLLRSDCQLIGGDSGGPLVDMHGTVIGIHSRIGTSLANNLHIPVDVIRDHWNELTSGKLARGDSYIGVRGSSSEANCQITSVTPGSPADRAGILVGDVITHFAGQRVYSFSELVMLVQMRKQGDPVTVKLKRNGEDLDLLVRIGRRNPSSRDNP